MPFDLPEEYLLGMAAWLAAGAVCFVALLMLRRRARKKRGFAWRLANAGLGLWVFLAAMTLVELYFAVVYDQSDSFNMTKVSQHWFQRHVRLNADGFRDDQPFPRSIPPGMKRLCFVGDSFTFGQGIKDPADRFSDRIRRRLESTRPGAFLVNYVGDTGIHVRLVANLVEKTVERGYQIDYLVYTICLNDIELYEPEVVRMQKRLDGQSPRFFLFRESYFLNMLYFRILQARLPDVRNYYSMLPDSYRGPPWQGMHRTLEELRKFCQSHNIELRIVIFPFLHNLGKEYSFDPAHEQISSYCREAGLACLDLKPVLLPHAGEGLTVNRFDPHPNERAHKIAAEAMEQDLLADLFTGRSK
jgi:hypothetical protein